jgi:hypothetical protein
MKRALLAMLLAFVAAPAPAMADTVTCADGTTSQAGRGACSHHGGVKKARTTKREAPRTTRTTKPDRVRCEDGTYSDVSGRGACSHHGGIAGEGPIKLDRFDPFGRDEGTQARVPRDEPKPRKRKTSWWGSDEPRPGEPLARCRDGSLSYSKHHRGTCSQHGGVRDWLDD